MSATKISTTTQDVWPRRLKEARLSAALSQRELGIAAGIDPSVASTRVNRYELGVHKADFQIAVQLAKVLNVPAAFFYAESDEIAAVLIALHRASATKRRHFVKLLLEQN